MSSDANLSDPMEFVAGGIVWSVDLAKVTEASERTRIRNRWSRAIALARAARMGIDGGPVLDRGDEAIDLSAYLAADSDPQRAYEFSGKVTRSLLSAQVGRALLVHAAALSQGDIALAFVAPSGTGKTTATATLGRQLDYITDETAIVLEDFTMLPYPKPLSVITDEASGLKEEFSPGDLGLGPTPTRPSLGGVIFLERDPSLGAPALEPIELGEAILRLCPETSSMPRLSEPLARVARVLERGLGAHVLRYSEIASTRELILEHLEGTVASLAQHGSEARSSSAWSHRPPPRDLARAVAPLRPEEIPTELRGRWDPEAQAAERAAAEQEAAAHVDESQLPELTPETIVQRAPWTDALLLHSQAGGPDDVLLLVGMVPIKLQALGGVMWQALDTPRSIAELTSLAQQALGEHPEAPAMVVEGVLAMVRARAALITSE